MTAEEVHIACLSTRKLQNYLVSLSSKRCHSHPRSWATFKVVCGSAEIVLIKHVDVYLDFTWMRIIGR